MTGTTSADFNIAADRLFGVEQIAAFINETPRRTFRMLNTKDIPGWQMGGRRWYASKQALVAHYQDRASGKAA